MGAGVLVRDLTVPALLVLGPLAGALLALAVLYAGRGGTAPAPIRFTLPDLVLPAPAALPEWITWRAPDRTETTMTLPWRRHPLASTWPDPPPATHMRQTTALTTSVARAWDQQGYDW